MAALATRRGRGRRAAALGALAVVLAVGLAPPAGARNENDPKYTDGQLKKRLKAELREQGLEPRGVSSCRPKRGKKVMVCKWRAKGVFPGEIPYECAGKAKFTVKGKTWEIDPCNSINEPMIPLNAEVGPHPNFGFNEDWVQQLDKLDQLAGSGANVARTGLYWDNIQPTSFNVHVWTLFDLVYQQMIKPRDPAAVRALRGAVLGPERKLPPGRPPGAGVLRRARRLRRPRRPALPAGRRVRGLERAQLRDLLGRPA